MNGSENSSAVRRLALCLLIVLCAGCSSLDAVRDFGKSAAAVSTYPLAATAYVDSAVTSAPFNVAVAVAVVSPPAPNALRLQRQQQVEAALGLQAALGDYFATLARLAGDDLATLSTAKAVGADMKAVRGGDLNRTTLDAYAGLIQTVAGFAELPARERAVKELVRAGGPDAMRLLQALRSVAADWRAQVANDAKQVDETLGTAVLASDVTPLLRILANDRRAELARGYAITLRQMGTIQRALDTVDRAHADMALHLDELRDETIRLRLQAAASELRTASATLSALR